MLLIAHSVAHRVIQVDLIPLSRVKLLYEKVLCLIVTQVRRTTAGSTKIDFPQIMYEICMYLRQCTLYFPTQGS